MLLIETLFQFLMELLKLINRRQIDGIGDSIYLSHYYFSELDFPSYNGRHNRFSQILEQVRFLNDCIMCIYNKEIANYKMWQQNVSELLHG